MPIANRRVTLLAASASRVYMGTHGTSMIQKIRREWGAQWDGRGVRFQLASRTAQSVELCLFGVSAEASEERVRLTRVDDAMWQVRVDGIGPGQPYGYRVSGPWHPEVGLFHNPAKLLLDPYAQAVSGSLAFHPSQTCWRAQSPDGSPHADPQDSAASGLRSVVVDPAFDWGDDRPPNVPWCDTVLYECHVRGMTALHPQVPPGLRGTYLGMCAPPVIAHLRELGVTTVSLMPIAASFTEQRLVALGLHNYWGYQPVAWLAPTPRYAAVAGQELRELKTLVRELHRAGIEVLLDVVLNHSGEGPSLGVYAGPLLGLRGIDPGYFRRDVHSPGLDVDYAGCGNTLDLRDPLCLQLAIECLGYWAHDVHVDGFRLDLAPILGRRDPAFDPWAPLWCAIDDDPALGALKWIAEPWDLGPNGYCLGRFRAPFREWNDRFRDGVRRYVRGDVGARAELATRLAGSADLFDRDGRDATSSVNYVACHDGFTLWDLVSYAHKHNLDNGEHNRDGRDDNISQGWGAEGPTQDADVNETRRRVASSMLVALFCAHGVPMLGHGDEFARTQGGNNNAYCQDNARSYVSWPESCREHAMQRLVRELATLRRERPVMRAGGFAHGELVPSLGMQDLSWWGADGSQLTEADWHDPTARTLVMLRCHDAGRGAADIVCALWNADDHDVEVRLPPVPIAGSWTVRIDVAAGASVPRRVEGEHVTVVAHGAQVLTWDVRA